MREKERRTSELLVRLDDIQFVYKKIEIVLKAIILKTKQSNSMKLNSLGVDYHKFILGAIS